MRRTRAPGRWALRRMPFLEGAMMNSSLLRSYARQKGGDITRSAY